jgi:hypothetical protein
VVGNRFKRDILVGDHQKQYALEADRKFFSLVALDVFFILDGP